jgi:hypothetical protein
MKLAFWAVGETLPIRLSCLHSPYTGRMSLIHWFHFFRIVPLMAVRPSCLQVSPLAIPTLESLYR